MERVEREIASCLGQTCSLISAMSSFSTLASSTSAAAAS